MILWFSFGFLLWYCLLLHVGMHLGSSWPYFTYEQVLGSKFDFPRFLCSLSLIYEIHRTLALIFSIVDRNRFLTFLMSYGWNLKGFESPDQKLSRFVIISLFTMLEVKPPLVRGQTAKPERSDCPTHFDLTFQCFWLLCFGVLIGFNTRLSLYFYFDLHNFHSYWNKN